MIESFSFIVFKILHDAELVLFGKNGLDISILVNGSKNNF